MRLCNGGQALLLNSISLSIDSRTQNKLEDIRIRNNNNQNECLNCNLNNNYCAPASVDTVNQHIQSNPPQKNLSTPEPSLECFPIDGFQSDQCDNKRADSTIVVKTLHSNEDKDGNNNHDCGDDPSCEWHPHKRFYDKPKFDQRLTATRSSIQQYPVSFFVHTDLLPVRGVFEKTIITDDDKPSPDNSLDMDDPLDDGTILYASNKLAKDITNERKLAADVDSRNDSEAERSDAWIHLGTSQSAQKSANDSAAFEVYNIDAELPRFNLDAIESHLKQQQQQFGRRNDRDEIRRRLAMGGDGDDIAGGRKPSLQSRLQGSMNLQICFMNDLGNDSDTESSSPPSPPTVLHSHKRPNTLQIMNAHVEPPTLGPPGCLGSDTTLAACQARLQAEARHALMQAHEMARMQMQVERQRAPISPITQMVRNSLLKVGVSFGLERRRLSRQLLTEMNIAQLQVIINDLHSQIELLNEELVQILVSRDDLHMEQDSMLVDIEDLTRYINAKDTEDAVQLRNVTA